MQRWFVMTVVGPDRPGLVESIASLVTAHSGNWLESRMSRLGGQFAGILRVEMPEAQREAFKNSLTLLESKGLAVVIQIDLPSIHATTARVTTIDIVGQDRPGIVKEISKVLASHGVNVEELETEVSSAAMSGETLFKARLQLSIPVITDASELRNDLERIAADLIVDIKFVEPASYGS